MRTQVLLCAMAVTGMALWATAAERRTYPCHRLAQAPVLDGKLDDPAWTNIPEATGFYVLGDSGEYAREKQTFFKAGWTEVALYIAIRAEETAPEKLKALRKDGGDLFLDDSVELFFLPPGARDYTQLLANCAGRRSNGFGSALNYSDSVVSLLGWDAQAVVGKTEWLLELRIPFAVLMAKAPREGEEWPVNIARNIQTGPAGEKFTCWPLLKNAYNDAPNFGRFVFEGAAGAKALDEEEKMNGPYIRDMRDKIEALAGMADRYASELSEAQKMDDQRVEAEQLRQVWQQVAQAADTPQGLSATKDAFRASVNLREKSEDCIDRGMYRNMLEALLKD